MTISVHSTVYYYILFSLLPQQLTQFSLQVDECGLPVPRTLARMASERGVRLVFGPKRGQWQIEADESAEERIVSTATKGPSRNRLGRATSRSRSIPSERSASMHALGVIQAVRSVNSNRVDSTNSQGSNDETRVEMAAINAPARTAVALDPARLLLPRTGYQREGLRGALAELQPIDEASASDQVFRTSRVGKAEQFPLVSALLS